MRRVSKSPKGKRRRIGDVSVYPHHGAWHIYYRDGARQVRRKAGETEDEAARVAAQVNAQLALAAPTLFSFTPVAIADLRQRWLDHHEHVLRSSLSTIARYRAATQHLQNFANEQGAGRPAHELDSEQFVRHLRRIRVAPNGHERSVRRPLRDKGVRFILETCRALYGYAAKKRHLPPYADNPFAGLGGKRFRIEDAKPIFVFDEVSELAFLKAAGPWEFAIHFTLAKTGMRPGELAHLLIEDIDLKQGWLYVRNKPDLGWRIKTGRDRAIPLVEELVAMLRHVIGARIAGPLFQRKKFAAHSAAASSTRAALGQIIAQRIDRQERERGECLSREEREHAAHRVWHEAGALRLDEVRLSFVRTAAAAGLNEASCPKSWRHTVATLMQDANVDVLVRQITLGHAPVSGGGALGMTAVYTHTRRETQRREFFRRDSSGLTRYASARAVCVITDLNLGGKEL